MSGQTIEAGDAENLQLSFDQEMLHTPEEASPTIPKEKTKNILWVDDSPDKNAFILKSLKELNFDVTTTTTTLAGVASFNERSYDLVISDMAKPFHFNLERILDIRIQLEERARMELGKAIAAATAQAREVARLETEKTEREVAMSASAFVRSKTIFTGTR